MAKKKRDLHDYKIWMLPDVHPARKKLPGKIRQRIKRIIKSLAQEPHPSNSISLSLTDTAEFTDWDVRRIRVDEWRIVYAVSETWSEVGITDSTEAATL